MKTTGRPGIPPIVDAELLQDLMRERSDVRLLDVRTSGEYESVHIRGSYNVPLDTLGEHAAEIRQNVESPVVDVCQSGARSRQGEEVLKRAGMPNLHVLDSILNEWTGAGKPVERGRERISLERQVRIAAGALTATGVLALAANPLFGLLSAFVGGGLVFAGVSNTCGMAAMLSKLPHNRAKGLRRGRHGRGAQGR